MTLENSVFKWKKSFLPWVWKLDVRWKTSE